MAGKASESDINCHNHWIWFRTQDSSPLFSFTLYEVINHASGTMEKRLTSLPPKLLSMASFLEHCTQDKDQHNQQINILSAYTNTWEAHVLTVDTTSSSNFNHCTAREQHVMCMITIQRGRQALTTHSMYYKWIRTHYRVSSSLKLRSCKTLSTTNVTLHVTSYK